MFLSYEAIQRTQGQHIHDEGKPGHVCWQAGMTTYCSKLDRVKVRYKGFWVDVVQEPGKVLAAEVLPQFQPICDIAVVNLRDPKQNCVGYIDAILVIS